MALRNRFVCQNHTIVVKLEISGKLPMFPVAGRPHVLAKTLLFALLFHLYFSLQRAQPGNSMKT